ncbi:MAG: MotA/TolQ/ExbB proton channel family protein [Lysobacterales bacterium]|jgi:biopolymer transport protein ExbB
MKRMLLTIPTCFALCLAAVSPAMAQDEPAQQEPPVESVAAPAPVRQDDTDAMDQLQAAYQKEYAFLEAQLRDLRQRSADFEAESARAETAREAEIDRMEGDWINLQSQAERLQTLSTEAERELESISDALMTLESTFQQAESTLEPYELEALSSSEYASASEAERIDVLFGQATGLLERFGKVTETPGSFFLTDGSEVQGSILRIGNVSAFGISDSGSGALAPAGEGQLKIWSEQPATETAQALASGQAPAQLELFLYESETKAIEERAGKTILSVINSGGTIAWIIVALGVLGAVLIVLRFLFLRSAGAATDKIVFQVGALVRKGKVEDALEACKKFKGSTARVVYMAVGNLDRDRAHLEDIISESILHESAHLNRFGSMILVIAAVAPLLGLLGTVTGMITTFDIITEFGTGDPKLLSGGISIALVTTEIGLAVAIPTLLLGNVLSGWAESIKDSMEKGALGVINQYKEHRRKV